MLTTEVGRTGSEEWDARFYHTVMAAQQVTLGSQLFVSMPEDLEGLVIDGGCGTGLVDLALLRHFPRVSLCAVDLSASMLAIARNEVEAVFPGRVSFVHADLQSFLLPNSAVCFFSNAAMHWVRDHGRLFANVFATLQPGGVLAAQMAWAGPHNRPWYDKMHAFLRSVPYDLDTADLISPVEFVEPRKEVRALEAAGFEAVSVQPHSHIFTFRNGAEHRLFMEKVVLRGPMARIGSEALRAALLDQAIAYSDGTVGPLKQCYESLRCVARRPRTH